MSSWAKATNRDGKVPSHKKTAASNKKNKKNVRKKNVKTGSKNKIGSTVKKGNVDRSTSPISPSILLNKKGFKHINVIQKDALLFALEKTDDNDNHSSKNTNDVASVAADKSDESSNDRIMPNHTSSTIDTKNTNEEETSLSSNKTTPGNTNINDNTSTKTVVKNHLLDNIKQQIQEKQIRKEKERLENLEYERKIQQTAQKYDYFFGSANKRGGGGTPIRHNGRSVANLKLIGKDLVTIQNNKPVQHCVPQHHSKFKGGSDGRSTKLTATNLRRPKKAPEETSNGKSIIEQRILKKKNQVNIISEEQSSHCMNAPTPSKNTSVIVRNDDINILVDEDTVQKKASEVESNDDDNGNIAPTLTPRQLYQQDLQKQIELKRQRKEKEKKEQLEWERKKDLEMLQFNPFGRGGNGAPIKDKKGKIVANLRTLGHDLVTINRGKIGTVRR
jgi:hypothetical protein